MKVRHFSTFYEARDAASKQLKGYPSSRVKEIQREGFVVELWGGGPLWSY